MLSIGVVVAAVTCERLLLVVLCECTTVITPAQIRVILDQIRGRTYEDALMILEYMPHRACDPILKLLVSVRCSLLLTMSDVYYH